MIETIIIILKEFLIPTTTAFIGFIMGKKIRVKIKVGIDRIEEEKQKNAKKGIILIISRYTSFSKITEAMNEDNIRKALERKNYEVLDLENSSLGHGITSILTHASNLEHCWIIGSYAKDLSLITSSSVNFEETFIEYLKQEKGLKCKFHYGKSYAIPMNDDALICNKAYKLTNDIFTEAKKHYKLSQKDIIVDVTGGTKSMNLGLVLASLHKDRDVQVIGSDYDEKGRPLIGEAYPVKIHFKPKIKK